jgi:hypothetical protein
MSVSICSFSVLLYNMYTEIQVVQKNLFHSLSMNSTSFKCAFLRLILFTHLYKIQFTLNIYSNLKYRCVSRKSLGTLYLTFIIPGIQLYRLGQLYTIRKT